MTIGDSAGEGRFFPPPGRLFTGVFTESGPHNLADTDAFIRATDWRPAVHEFSAGWAHGGFDRALFDRLASRGMMPVLAWEPWDYLAPNPREIQPDYRLRSIIDGLHDDYIEQWAEGIRDLGYPIAVRFAHEMNGSWYPWSEQVNGNQGGEYGQAYRHVHDLFASVGAGNVTWIWSPNVSFVGSASISDLYPGSGYVDWFGLSGYYEDGVFEDFDTLYAQSISELEALDDKPIVITEIGAPAGTGRQVEWISEMFAALPRHPAVIGFIWFEVEMHEDWRVAPRAESSRIFAQGLALGDYDVAWSPDMHALTRRPQ